MKLRKYQKEIFLQLKIIKQENQENKVNYNQHQMNFILKEIFNHNNKVE